MTPGYCEQSQGRPTHSDLITGKPTKLLLLILSLALAWLWLSCPVLAQEVSNSPNPNLWVVDGAVYGMARMGDVIYIGGDFTYVGPATGTGVLLDTIGGLPPPTFSDVVDGNVSAAVADGHGGWYIGGSFSHVGGLARNRLAHLRADGSVDPQWNPDVGGQNGGYVLSLAV
ncbi:MAG TPA: delta-60 repeat domain-containing protein, partial [Caldilineaceae bacterium]|nr:delta-60 repeat domain-containing protein [Caldilineaceae bacterium]